MGRISVGGRLERGLGGRYCVGGREVSLGERERGRGGSGRREGREKESTYPNP